MRVRRDTSSSRIKWPQLGRQSVRVPYQLQHMKILDIPQAGRRGLTVSQNGR